MASSNFQISVGMKAPFDFLHSHTFSCSLKNSIRNLMADFATAVKYQLPIKVVIVKNGTLGQIKWEQMVFLGNPEYGVDLQPIDFAGFAQCCGGTGFTAKDPSDCGRVVEE